MDFHEDFIEANKGNEIKQGKNEELKLLIDGKEFKANFVNINRTNVESDTLQIRYDSNSKLKEFLIEKFNTSYTYIKERKEEGKRKQIEVPEEIEEYIEFYQTDKPFQYKVKLKTNKEENNILAYLFLIYLIIKKKQIGLLI